MWQDPPFDSYRFSYLIPMIETSFSIITFIIVFHNILAGKIDWPCICMEVKK